MSDILTNDFYELALKKKKQRNKSLAYLFIKENISMLDKCLKEGVTRKNLYDLLKEQDKIKNKDNKSISFTNFCTILDDFFIFKDRRYFGLLSEKKTSKNSVKNNNKNEELDNEKLKNNEMKIDNESQDKNTLIQNDFAITNNLNANERTVEKSRPSFGNQNPQ